MMAERPIYQGLWLPRLARVKPYYIIGIIG